MQPRAGRPPAPPATRPAPRVPDFHQRLHHLRIPVRYLVQRPREERDARLTRRLVHADVRLGADAVVLVLDGERRRQRRRDLLGRLERLGEHEADRVEERERRSFQCVVLREHGHLADVAAQEVRAPHRRERPAERLRDRLLDLRLLEPDAQLAAA